MSNPWMLDLLKIHTSNSRKKLHKICWKSIQVTVGKKFIIVSIVCNPWKWSDEQEQILNENNVGIIWMMQEAVKQAFVGNRRVLIIRDSYYCTNWLKILRYIREKRFLAIQFLWMFKTICTNLSLSTF